jgi:hypothetical protein
MCKQARIITAVAREQLCEHVVFSATRGHATMEAVFSLRCMPRLCIEDQLPLRDNFAAAVRIVRGWCEMSVCLRGREPGNRGTPMIESVESCFCEKREAGSRGRWQSGNLREGEAARKQQLMKTKKALCVLCLQWSSECVAQWNFRSYLKLRFVRAQLIGALMQPSF